MFCVKCGQSVPDGTSRCPHCGAELHATDAPVAPVSEPPKKFPLLAVILPVAVFLVAIFGILLFKGLSTKDAAPQAAAESSAMPESQMISDAETSIEESSEEQEISIEESSVEESSEAIAEAESSVEEEESSEQEPEPVHAFMELVTTDVSEYPLVRAYFRVENSETGEVISDLAPDAFKVQERLSGGAYVEREVRNAEQLKGNQGLHIALVADKSDSIYDSDMEKIKAVMSEFVDRLDFASGDKAEVLAFDSIVQQMCYFTNDSNLLKNGISYMETDGMTALYDAIYDGINHAALQGGARCVIAFTDGIDNMSRYNSDEVLRHALEMQAPVYIIGVGSDVDEYTLRTIASSSGGQYWFIDDLYDLEEIYNQIYATQMDIYMVEYVSEGDGDDAYAPRDLSVSVSQGACEGGLDVSFTPVRSAEKRTHTSRYELIKESLTWEEAAERCQEMGGHLATITSQEEMDTLVAMAQESGLIYLWIGGYTSYDSDGNVFGHWITGESFIYEKWADGEPSRVDHDGTEEWYLMLWNIERLGGWTWNDQRNDPAGAVQSMADKMGYICEYED